MNSVEINIINSCLKDLKKISCVLEKLPKNLTTEQKNSLIYELCLVCDNILYLCNKLKENNENNK